ncbi:MAG TPA: hypothetical protein PKA00_02415, partial [Saprospiraceae bacterium]|nr:hypothetical protein [Saprospiraceae bacterium]HMQ81726.1 hypothetical protein [Saprospiraceae bacterium]
MNVRFTLLILCLACYSNLLAQPANDECTGAQTLNLGTPSPCPLSFPVTNTFMSNNINATSTVPYPQFTGCNPGGSTTGPAAEVWYTFTATSNQISITVSGGLAVPNIVLFTGPNCFALNPEVCARGTGNTVTLTASVTAGTTYYMLISGGDVTDQGNFTISIQSSRDCSPCVTGDALVPMPPPQNGTYASNQVVNFCYTMLNWDVTGTVEWFHAIQVQLGPGWDASTLTPTMAPPSCDGTGIWLWFDSWTSCATGQTWGPGYAYESGAGIGCGGSPIDGDPGNNWGDGNGTCAAIGSTAPPKTFCFSVQVADCLSGGNFNGNDLSVTIFPLSDGQSGSWTQVGCNSGTSYNFLASAICCDDLDPVVTDFELSSCAASCDGSITFIGGGDSQPGDSWTYLVFDQFNNVVGNFNIPSSDYQTLTGLCPGSYSIQAVNAISGCTRSETFNLGVEPPFFAIANYTPVCPGEPLQVFGSADLSGDTEIYTWTGPGGITVQGQDAILPFTGIWTLNVTVDGCPATPDMVDVQYVQTNTSALANPDEVCAGDPINLQASGGVFYDWGAEGIGASITTFAPNVASPQTITYSVTISTAQGCDVVEEVMVLVNPLPEAEIIGPTDACQDETVILTAVGGVDFEWSTSGDDFIEAVTLTAADAPIASYSVTVTDLNGCMDDAQWSILVNPPPAAMASANPETVCAGQSTQLTATGGLFYDWSTSQTGATITITPAASDIIEVTVTDANECRAVAEVAVFVDQPIAAPVVQCGTVTPSSVQFTWGAVTGATAYQVVVTTSQGGTLSGTTYTVNGLSPGELVTIQVTAVGTNSCPNPTTTFSCNALSCPPVTVTINTVAPICLTAGSPVVNLTANIAGNTMAGTTTWSGTGITNTATGTFDPNVAGVGAHTVTATYTEGLCTYTDDLVIQVFQTPTANFSINDTDICETESVTVTYTGNASAGANFNWNFGGGTAVPGTGIGPHTVTWTTGGSKTITLTVSENGCSSTTASQMVQVQDELASPVISCGTATTSSVTFNWASITGATGYTVNVLTGQSGTQAGNSYTVTGLMPGELVTIQVTALNSGPCGPSNATFSCNAANCPVFQITIPDFTVGNNICLVPTSPNVTLTASVTGGAGGGTGVWSGPGIINASAGTFSPVAAGLGTHTITFTYSEGACSASATTTINVLLTPIASFSVESPICITESSTLVYTGNASPAAFYSWDFGGGTAVPGGNGPGPQEVNWPTAGTKTLVLNVTQGNCASEEFIQTVVVEPELAAPSISCNTTTSSVEFTWPNVTGASSYNVTVLSGPSGIQSGNSYLVTGLNPGTSVEIQVEAVGTGACGSSFATAICTADDCPNVTITIDPIDPICLDGAAAVIDLEATVSGSMGTGSENWSGTGIINMATGLFDPIIAGAGFHTITFSYEENNCSYDSSIDIVVNPQPNATITVDSPICITQTSTVTYTGGASPAAMYSWNFDGGIGNPGAGVGPHEISWPSVGGKTITLTVTEANCTSEPFSQSVTVESELIEPDITCTTTTSTVEFSWADVPGAISYNVTVLSGPAGVLSGNSYLVSGLNPGDMVEIQVEAVGTGPCGSSFATANCVAQDCPTVNIDIDNVVPICLNAAAAVIDLEAALTGASGAGSETWSGNGITN